ncbi:MAG: glycosyltransferase [Cyanobacteria bacterium J06632_3]
MKKIMFYCQHILGMGHLIRSMEIARGLSADFEVCFINGGQIVEGFQVPPSVQVVNLPAIKSDSEFRELQPVNSLLSLDYVKTFRTEKLLSIVKKFQPDVLMVELFPFGRRRFSFELIPLIEAAKAQGAKVISSLRDIVVTKKHQDRHEAKIVRLMNQYFDQLLIHGDPVLHPLEHSFSRVSDLTCDVRYTGYVTQQINNSRPTIIDRVVLAKPEPMIVVSVGGGRFGYELLDAVVQAAPLLAKELPQHRIQVFGGPFIPNEKFWDLRVAAQDYSNIHIHRYTPNLMVYMERAELSISMSGYNTTMNILATGVNAMMLPFTGNDDQEQTMRVERLAQLGKVRRIYPDDLLPDRFAAMVVEHLQYQPAPIDVNLAGVEGTAYWVKSLVEGTLPQLTVDGQPLADREVQMSMA